MYVIRKILHPTDFSEQARSAFALACSLARVHHARVVVVHVVQPTASFGEVAPVPPPEDYYERLWNDYLLPMEPPEAGVAVEHLLVDGVAEEEIVRLAGELRSDLIVMGTHGRAGLSRLLMGSVAEHVVRTAPCPVLTVREPISESVPVAEEEEARTAAGGAT